MKKSILRLAVFSVLPLLVIVYAIYFLERNTDDYYKRFTSPQQNSLILGSSRAAIIDPAIMDGILHEKFPNAVLYNYSFTWAHSPYGPKYLESIEKKIKPDTKDGVFVITVEPTALMVDKNKPDSPEFYIEKDKSVAKTSMVAISPNIEYLFESYEPSLTNELNKKIKPSVDAIGESTILDNGQYDIKIIKKVSPEKQAMFNRSNMAKLRERMNGLKVSDNRIAYLEETINFLKKHGKVIVVRMPINKEPYSIENNVFPDFDTRMDHVAAKTQISYINYNNSQNQYKWLDEVHLDKNSEALFSATLARDILSH